MMPGHRLSAHTKGDHPGDEGVQESYLEHFVKEIYAEGFSPWELFALAWSMVHLEGVWLGISEESWDDFLEFNGWDEGNIRGGEVHSYKWHHLFEECI